MFENMTKTELYAILTGVFTASLIVSNIIAGKTRYSRTDDKSADIALTRYFEDISASVLSATRQIFKTAYDTSFQTF